MRLVRPVLSVGVNCAVGYGVLRRVHEQVQPLALSLGPVALWVIIA